MSLPTTTTVIRIAGQPRQAGAKFMIFEEPEPAREEGVYAKFFENGQYYHRRVPMTYPVCENTDEPVDEITSTWPVTADRTQ